MTTPALSAREVKKVYRPRNRPEVPALKGVSLEVGRGERVGLLGRNGAGKTTFLKIASTLLRPTSGEITIFGHDVMAHPEEVRPLIAVVPQEGKPFFHLTPREQVYTYLRTRGFSRESARTRTEEAIEQMGLGEVADRLNVTLSGGQMQRAMVATIIATEAPLLFLDEPTIGMDPFARRGVWDSLRRLTRKGSTILLTTHYLDEAEVLSDHIYIVDRGKVLAAGTAEELKRKTGGTLRVSIRGANHMREGFRSFGDLIVEDDTFHIITEPPRVPEIMQTALDQKLSVTVGPVTLEEAFLRLVGRSINDES